MKRCEMIKDKKDFNSLFHSKIFIKDRYFVIYIRKSEIDSPTFGIAISKKVGNAVARNKLKRQTRYLIDQNKKLFQNQADYIIMIRNECAGTQFQILKDSFEALLKRKVTL